MYPLTPTPTRSENYSSCVYVHTSYKEIVDCRQSKVVTHRVVGGTNVGSHRLRVSQDSRDSSVSTRSGPLSPFRRPPTLKVRLGTSVPRSVSNSFFPQVSLPSYTRLQTSLSVREGPWTVTTSRRPRVASPTVLSDPSCPYVRLRPGVTVQSFHQN